MDHEDARHCTGPLRTGRWLLSRSLPPWSQPRGKSMVSSVNSHTDATRIG
jgi:hypothetical protein